MLYVFTCKKCGYSQEEVLSPNDLNITLLCEGCNGESVFNFKQTCLERPFNFNIVGGRTDTWPQWNPHLERMFTSYKEYKQYLDANGLVITAPVKGEESCRKTSPVVEHIKAKDKEVAEIKEDFHIKPEMEPKWAENQVVEQAELRRDLTAGL